MGPLIHHCHRSPFANVLKWSLAKKPTNMVCIYKQCAFVSVLLPMHQLLNHPFIGTGATVTRTCEHSHIPTSTKESSFRVFLSSVGNRSGNILPQAKHFLIDCTLLLSRPPATATNHRPTKNKTHKVKSFPSVF